MAQEYIAVEGMTLSFQNPAHSGTITVTPLQASVTTKIDNKGVYSGPIAITISAGTDGSITNATGAGTFIPSSTSTKVDNKFVLRKDDITIPITMTGTNPSPPPPTSTYITVVKISAAGQTSTKSD